MAILRRVEANVMSDFYIVPGAVVSDVLAHAKSEVLQTVEQAYLLHETGEATSPESCFLRFPSKPDSRAIALPAYVGGVKDSVGIKWVASFPQNLAAGLPRASAVLILNDYETGRPYACLEAAQISAARTAASAAVSCGAVYRSTNSGSGQEAMPEHVTVGFVGTGVIARTIARYLAHAGLSFSSAVAHDLSEVRSKKFCRWLAEEVHFADCRAAERDEALGQDLIVFATTAAAPYVPPSARFKAGQLILNVSLRDLAPDTLLAANNLVDDIEACLRAQTSPHLAAQECGSQSFISGTIAQAIRGAVSLDPGMPTIVSPFGLGVLDVAVGQLVFERSSSDKRVAVVPDFIPH
jgi:2,3-diaminopropionate biosynthesis protein SbnB